MFSGQDAGSIFMNSLVWIPICIMNQLVFFVVLNHDHHPFSLSMSFNHGHDKQRTYRLDVPSLDGMVEGLGGVGIPG